MSSTPRRRPPDRRAQFFLAAAATSAAMAWPTPDDFRWLALGLSGLYVLLALASTLDARSQD